MITNLSAQTDLNHLYAIGETAHTGLHGANRMASNSLLECLVFAESCAKSIQNDITLAQKITTKHVTHNISKTTDEAQALNIQTLIRKVMWKHVGIVRNDRGLHNAQIEINKLKSEFDAYYPNPTSNRDTIETRNLLDNALITIQCALQRKESRGLHFNSDYPNQLEIKIDSIHTISTNANQ